MRDNRHDFIDMCGEKPMEVRFWRHVDNGPVRIKVKSGQVLRWHKGERTDEGWRSISEEYWHDGEYLYCRWQRDGRDCDGRLTTGGLSRVNIRHYCEGDAVCWRDPDPVFGCIEYPAWVLIENDPVYDEYAQAAGY